MVKPPDDQSNATPSALTPNTITISEPQAQSGGIGEFIALSRKRNDITDYSHSSISLEIFLSL